MAAAERVLAAVLALVPVLVLVRAAQPEFRGQQQWAQQRGRDAAPAAGLADGDTTSEAVLQDEDTVPAAVLYGECNHVLQRPFIS